MKKILLLLSLLLATNAWGEEIRIACFYNNITPIFVVDTKEKTIYRDDRDWVLKIIEFNNNEIYAEVLSEDKKSIRSRLFYAQYKYSKWAVHTGKELLKKESSKLRKEITKMEGPVSCVNDTN
jgi:hypothetical protein